MGTSLTLRMPIPFGARTIAAMSGHAHDHAVPAGAGRERRLVIAIFLNVGIVVAQLVAGFASGSLGLLADAGHNLTDVLAIAVALIAVLLTRRPRTGQRSFGWHRATVLAALFNAASIMIVCVFVVIESLRRLGDPQPVDGGIVIAFAVLGAAFNTIAAFVVHDGSTDVNMRGALLHLIADALTSVAVAIAGLVMWVTDDYYWLDPTIALIISALIAWQGWRLAKAALDILLESTPHGMDPEAVTTAIESVEGVDAVHDFHVWSLSSEMRALSAHVVVSGHPTLEEAQAVGARIKAVLARDFAIAHATIELECEPCADDPHCEADVPAASAPHVHAP